MTDRRREPLPSIDAPREPVFCKDCGEELVLVAPSFCGACEDRHKTEAIIDSGNEYRRLAQFRLDMELVRARTRAHVKPHRRSIAWDTVMQEWREKVYKP